MVAAIISPLWFLAATAQASRFLYVSSYGGTITTSDMGMRETCSVNCDDATTVTTGVPLLRTVSSTNGCAGSPSWLTLDRAKSVLYCIDEGLTAVNGSLSSFATSAHGGLRKLDKVPTPGGPVSGVLYGQNRKGLAVAHYSPGALTTWDVSDPTRLTLIQSEQYKIAHSGPILERQDASHAHQTFLDPTGSFILVPDLGADKVHVYAVPKLNNLKLRALSSISVKPGSGPRHVAFAACHGKTFMYLVTELANTIIGYEVTYASASIQFRQLFTIGTHGAYNPVPKGAAAAEIAVSPDANYLIVSSRNESALSIPNFDPRNSTRIVSDSLINFSIDAKTGTLTRIQQVASGGRFPRQFSINQAGTLLAVGQQSDGRVVLINRDVNTGRLGSFAAYANVAGPITSVVFDEGD
ncbi:hypothetical protein E4U55_004345 [Claviceps digitariae]|nr:hypothetical protein E4U55_004345 [Claviceps digitariae]